MAVEWLGHITKARESLIIENSSHTNSQVVDIDTIGMRIYSTTSIIFSDDILLKLDYMGNGHDILFPNNGILTYTRSYDTSCVI